MEMSLRAVDGVVIVDVAGRLTVDSCVERPLARMIERLLADGKRQFLLNFESTTHIDSMGLADLLDAYRAVKRDDGQLKLECVTRHVDELLRVTGVARILECHYVEADAVASFQPAGRSTRGALRLVKS